MEKIKVIVIADLIRNLPRSLRLRVGARNDEYRKELTYRPMVVFVI